MKARYNVLLILLSYFNGSAQWQVLGPSPIYEILSYPYFINEEQGFVGAGDGFLYKSMDGFNTYEKISTGGEGDIRQLQFVDDSTGYMIMSPFPVYGDILKTTNGGKTWSKLSNSMIEFPINLSFVNKDTGFISTNAKILFTTDGGTSWEIVSNLTGYIKFISPNEGFRIEGGDIYKTENRGENWQLLNFPDTEVFDVTFQDNLRILLLGKNPESRIKIILTSDGGLTWIQKNTEYTTSYEVLFKDSTIILMSQNAVRSDDLGNTWTTISSPDIFRVFTRTYCLKDKYYKFGFGGGIISSNDGKTWKNQGSRHGGQKINFTDSLNGFTAPWFVTTDGGRNWKFREIDMPFMETDLYDYHFFTPLIGIFAIPSAFYKTSDGGQTWDTVFTPDYQERFVEFYFVDSTYGYALMAKEDATQLWEWGIRKTTDGGNHWSDFNQIPVYEAEGLYFPTRNLGFARNRLGDDACRTTDGSAHWYLSQFGRGPVSFYDSLNGFGIIQYDQYLHLYKTSDGGNTSSLVNADSPGWKVYFINSSTGWSSLGGKIYMTTNGGENWSLEFSGLYNITDFYFKDNILFAAGEYGTLLKRTGIVSEAEYISNALPVQFILYQNYPNPVNPSTTIKFSIPITQLVTLKIYDLLGREIQMLINNIYPPGTYSVDFDAEGFASGVYLYRMNFGSFTQVKKMQVIK